MFCRRIQQSHIYTAAETSGTALGRKELLWKLRLHKLPRAELSGQNMTGFCQEKNQSSWQSPAPVRQHSKSRFTY